MIYDSKPHTWHAVEVGTEPVRGCAEVTPDAAEYLAERSIWLVEKDPVEPTGLGAKTIITNLFRQYANKQIQKDRGRVLELLRASIHRIRANKGRGWEAELERLAQEVDHGHQQIPGTT